MSDDEQIMLITMSSTSSCVLFLICLFLLHLPLMKCNPCFAVLPMIIGVVITFFGGILFNMAGWTALTMGLCGYPIGLGCALPAFFAFGLMIGWSTGVGSPVTRYMKLEETPDLHQISVCDWPVWDSSDAGVYFRDGVLTRSGVEIGSAVANVKHCAYQPGSKNRHGYWTSCHFGVRPIFRCDSIFGSCEDEPPCAWAVTRDGTVPVAVPCGEGNFASLCGFATSLPKLSPMCVANGVFGQSISQACHEGISEMTAAIQEAATALNVSFSENTPLIRLANPDVEKDELHEWYVGWWCLMLYYTVVPAVLLCIFGKSLASRERQSTDSGDAYVGLE
eukprot:TRINITY_DN62948_c0_g1_i1.p1 TRINITY_DN62948_c0_g1~~TRINITY_DN62948_c0_g1_i1.p1  ORF type:complete len:335 (+),score=28.45 TRINITY_DN62948_c0_g1_i1:43-1047(+)